ncbi:ATP-binding protein [Parabacteroides chinchillae]
MDNLSFHITDIIANSIRAGATEIGLLISDSKDAIEICIKDNGCGMDAETLARVTNPFYTTRTTRKVGLGLPFLIQNAEQTGGSVSIISELGKGTTVTARFISTNIDCPPWGDLPATVAMLITGNPDVNICFSYRSGKEFFDLSTNDIKEALDGMPVSHPKVMLFIKDMIRENIGGN